MRRKSLADPFPTQAPPRVHDRARSLGQRLSETRARVAMLEQRTDLLGSRDRIECRSLLQSLELRHADLTLELERLANEAVVPDKKWARLEASCSEVAEHLGFLEQIICGRTHEPPRRART